jgi:hypothetical protein
MLLDIGSGAGRQQADTAYVGFSSPIAVLPTQRAVRFVF